MTTTIPNHAAHRSARRHDQANMTSHNDFHPRRIAPSERATRRGPEPKSTRTEVALDVAVVDELNRCAAAAGVCVSDLIGALLSAHTPSIKIGDLVHASGNGDVVYRVARMAPDGSALLEAAHGLHRHGGITSPGWTSAHQITGAVSAGRHQP